MQPVRIQRKRVKGWRMPPNTVSVTRPGKFGNPWKIGDHCAYSVRGFEGDRTLRDVLIERNGEPVYRTQQDLVDAYKERVRGSDALQRLAKYYLKGKDLACWCKEGEPCHADILLKIANQ